MNDFCAPRSRYEWSRHSDMRRLWETNDKADWLIQHWLMPSDETDVCVLEEVAQPGVEQRFSALADKWSEETSHISSTSDLVSHPSYQAIINLGWDVVPFLLNDLQTNKRFWFPALHAITNVRPFDQSDAGNGRRMTDAWIRWGRRKGLI